MTKAKTTDPAGTATARPARRREAARGGAGRPAAAVELAAMVVFLETLRQERAGCKHPPARRQAEVSSAREPWDQECRRGESARPTGSWRSRPAPRSSRPRAAA